MRTSSAPIGIGVAPERSARVATGASSEAVIIPLYRVGVSEGSTLTQKDGGLLLVTSARPGNFAAYCIFDIPDIAHSSRRLEVALQVLSGEVEVGWFLMDRKRWAVSRSANSGKHIIDLIIPAGTSGGQLVIQNRAMGSSHVLIEALIVPPNHADAEAS